MLFDGYSDSISMDVPPPSGNLSLTLYAAPRQYDPGNDGNPTGLMAQIAPGAGFLLGTARDGVPVFRLHTKQGMTEIKALDHPLPIGAYTQITAVYDAPRAMLYLDGRLAGEEVLPGPFAAAAVPLEIGKNPLGNRLKEGASLCMWAGLIVKPHLWERALLMQEILALVKQKPALEEGELALSRIRPDEDRHRPQYHLSPPRHWMNEPHAPLYFQGKYHLFYQSNAKGPFFYHLHWGHWVSSDLAHWRDLPPALNPRGGDMDPDGCWSGSAALGPDGLPRLFYTAGNLSLPQSQSVAIACSTYDEDGDSDLVHWCKPGSPAIIPPPGHERDFRDPFVFRHKEEWLLLVGASLKEQGGTALIYASRDLIHWEAKGPLFISDFERYPQTGTMWELPVLLPIGHGKYLLMVCACGVPHEAVDNYYWLGTLDGYRFVPDHKEPRLLDLGGGHFTGPSGFVTPDGRSVIFSIAQGRRTFEHEQQAGWAHNAGLPLSVALNAHGALRVAPIRELRGLRERQLLRLRHVPLKTANEFLSSIHGDMLEIRLEAVLLSPISLLFGKSPQGEEQTTLYYDGENFLMDRTRTSLDDEVLCKGVQGGKVSPERRLALTVYLDRSMAEAYVNHRASLTTRVYPSRKDATGLALLGEDEQIIGRLDVYALHSCFGRNEP